jgi:hypothetical protein
MGFPRVHSSPVIALLPLLLGLLLVAAPADAQRSADPRGLVGEWVGTWKSTGGGSSGNLWITVDVVDGETVRGSLFMAVVTPSNQGYYNREVPFAGGFDGTVLRVTVLPALWFSMTVSGDAMRGEVQGQQTFGTVELQRKR